MEVITDWKGNPLLKDQTIVCVRTKPLFKQVKMGFLDLTNGGFHCMNTYNAPKYIWKVLGKYKLFEIGETLYYTIETENHNYHLNMSSLGDRQDGDIICIEGISENEEEYYLNYFK